ncbi:hypothetical protein NUV66_07805 [Pseudomonas sp. 32.2.56]|uniref:hypothetical protein n=1 Tax=Pseudomonas sp. 32.2.56 TaxID=2969303 RepID=UPI00214F8610|nr:hypothetical protein [Pseudomonas sp. 32.2.56]MCR4509207.1 hypothetical protein [Pseudomonas sp. 32.2.56]
MARKDFSSAAALVVEGSLTGQTIKERFSKPTNYSPLSYVIHFPESPSTVRKINFERCYGAGCDEVAYYCQQVIEMLLESALATRGKTKSVASIITYAKNISKSFLRYCSFMSVAMGGEIGLRHIDRKFVMSFIRYLETSGAGYTTQKNVYTCCKSVLRELVSFGLLSSDIFPPNPYPHSNRRKSGESGFSKKEFTQVVNALKKEVIAVKGASGSILAEELAFCAVAIVARTGLNLTPLIELSMGCLLPHPLRHDRSILVSYKRRAHKINYQSLSGGTESAADDEVDTLSVVMPDIASIINMVAERNSVIRSRSTWSNRLFVRERPLRGFEERMPAPLTINTINRALETLVARHGLISDNGEKLIVNVSRLRKTFANKIWELSGNDPFVTAMLAGNTQKVLMDSYLEAPADAEKNWALMGEVRNKELLESDNGSFSGIPVKELNTAVARCKDTVNGHRAPKNGSHCTEFLNCFRCSSFVVTADDLYRLLSFYWLLVRERGRIGAKNWVKLYRHIIKIIDEKILPQFDTAFVAAARARAKQDPHPFWKDPGILELA